MDKIRRSALILFDILLIPAIYPAGLILKIVRRIGVHRLPLCKRALLHIGIFPIRRHYYEPLFDSRDLRCLAEEKRKLSGIDFNVTGQLDILKRFDFNSELIRLDGATIAKSVTFHISNPAFGSGDAEYLYNFIRLTKPKKIIEIGSGYSTLVGLMATSTNQRQSEDSKCNYICIEPFEMPWLESIGVQVIRNKVEDVGLDIFNQLDDGDILFIDSSHIIRPQGDVLFEYLELLPTLKPGVVVHIHDIFSPKDYPARWMIDEVKFWNEQYILEAFLTCNTQWKIIGALNYLKHWHYTALKECSPFLTPERQPGSFYIQKIK